MPGLPDTGRSLHVDVPLSNVLLNRRPSGFVADTFIPVTPVAKQSDTYFKFYHGQWHQHVPGMTLRAPRTEPRKVHFSVASDTFYAHNYALATDFAAEDVVNADTILNWAESHGDLLTTRLLMDYEWRIAQLLRATGSVRTLTLVGCGWPAGGAPIVTQMFDYMEQFRAATGLTPNLLIIPQGIRRYVATNSQLVGVIKGTNGGGLVTESNLAGLFGIERVITPQTQVNTFGDMETLNGSWSFADVWGNDRIWLAHVRPLAGRETDTWINAFRWTNPLLGTPWAVERFPYDAKRKVYEMQVGYYQGEKIVSSDLAMAITVNST